MGSTWLANAQRISKKTHQASPDLTLGHWHFSIIPPFSPLYRSKAHASYRIQCYELKQCQCWPRQTTKLSSKRWLATKHSIYIYQHVCTTWTPMVIMYVHNIYPLYFYFGKRNFFVWLINEVNVKMCENLNTQTARTLHQNQFGASVVRRSGPWPGWQASRGLSLWSPLQHKRICIARGRSNLFRDTNTDRLQPQTRSLK